jgi:hypothetical protein
VWNIGPQKTLYVPGPWMHKGENTVVAFDGRNDPCDVSKNLRTQPWRELTALALQLSCDAQAYSIFLRPPGCFSSPASASFRSGIPR